MKLYELAAGATSLDGLRQAERPVPRPGPTEVLVRVRAASLNYRDQLIVAGHYLGGAVARDTIPLSDGAGEVAEIGAEVTRVHVGDRVAGTFFPGWIDGLKRPVTGGALGAPADGVLAEYIVLDEAALVAVPAHLSFAEAACLPCAAVTAWHALTEYRRLLPGDRVLVLGTGGVSIFALQFARLAGAEIYVTSSSDAKLERAIELGAKAGINYRRTPEWEREVLRLTDGAGVDSVIEVGGAGTFGRSVQAVATGGEISLIGVLDRTEANPNLALLMFKYASVRGIFVGNRRMFEEMNRAIEAHRLVPVIDRIFGFDEAAEAYRYQMTGAHFGKIVIAL